MYQAMTEINSIVEEMTDEVVVIGEEILLQMLEGCWVQAQVSHCQVHQVTFLYSHPSVILTALVSFHSVPLKFCCS